MGGEIEGDGETFLAGGEVAAVEGVGIFSGGEAGVLADRPRLVGIHGGVGAAAERGDAGEVVQEVEAGRIGGGVQWLHRNALRRFPQLRSGFTGQLRPCAEIGAWRQLLERELGEVGERQGHRRSGRGTRPVS